MHTGLCRTVQTRRGVHCPPRRARSSRIAPRRQRARPGRVGWRSSSEWRPPSTEQRTVTWSRSRRPPAWPESTATPFVRGAPAAGCRASGSIAAATGGSGAATSRPGRPARRHLSAPHSSRPPPWPATPVRPHPRRPAAVGARDAAIRRIAGEVSRADEPRDDPGRRHRRLGGALHGRSCGALAVRAATSPSRSAWPPSATSARPCARPRNRLTPADDEALVRCVRDRRVQVLAEPARQAHSPALRSAYAARPDRGPSASCRSSSARPPSASWPLYHEAVRAWPEGELDLARAFADQVASAVANAQLRDETHELAARLKAIQELGGRLEPASTTSRRSARRSSPRPQR